MTSENIDGGKALIRALEKEGVEVMFGLPGGAILPVYDPIIDSTIRHILYAMSKVLVTWLKVMPKQLANPV